MELMYQIALINVEWDNTYTNAVRFNNRAEQETYFNIPTIFDTAPAINFNLGTLLKTSVCVRLDTTVLKLMNYNYCVIRSLANTPLQYYYYFINDIIYDTATQVTLNLELDVITTYYCDLKFNDCWCDRAHLPRFISVNNELVQFNYLADNNYLFERENLEKYSKRVVDKYKLGLQIDGKNYNDFYAWIKANISGWVYVFLSEGEYKTYEVGFTSGQPRQLTATRLTPIRYGFGTTSSVEGSVSVICYPIYKGLGKLYVNATNVPSGKVGGRVELSEFGFSQFESHNIDSVAKIYNMKLSCMPPYITENFNSYTINGNDLYLNGSISSDNKTIQCATNIYYPTRGDFGCIVTELSGRGMIVLQLQNLLNTQNKSICVTEKLELGNYYPKVFYKSSIKQDSNHPLYNPKMQSEDIMEIKISCGYGDSFIYDYQKLNKSEIQFYYTEMITPEITKILISYKPTDNLGIFSLASTNNYTGFIGSNDLAIPYNNSQYASFIAQNKNFFLQRDIKQTVGTYNGIMNSGALILNGKLGSGVASGMGTVINQTAERLQSNLTLDNMRNSKQDLHNATGNVIFNMNIQEIAPYVEIYKTLDQQMQNNNDYMNLYGFAYNRQDNIKNLDNIRKYYNYIKALPEMITTDYGLANNVRQRIKDIITRGVRLWNVTDNMFNFSAPNYERGFDL